MKTWGLFITATLGLVFAVRSQTQPQDPNSQLPTPGFHHLHLNSPDPDAASKASSPRGGGHSLRE
jgi:hypothetical protein